MSHFLVPEGGLEKTWSSTSLTHLRGQVSYHDDLAPSTGTGVRTKNSGMKIKAVIVQNNSGGVLNRGEACSWDTAAVGEKVGGKAGEGVPVAGFVPEDVGSAGVPDGYHFWLIQEGPAYVVHAGNDTISAGSLLAGGASGRVDLFDGTATAATEPVSIIGRAIENPADVAATRFRALVSVKGF